MKHPHAEIIKALADDDSLTLWAKGKGYWFLLGSDKLRCVVLNPDLQFHLGPTPPPRMIETPFGSYPEPLREAPKQETFYWLVKTDGTEGYPWLDLEIEMKWLKAGLIHLTREAAEQQAQVELKRRMAELGWEKS